MAGLHANALVRRLALAGLAIVGFFAPVLLGGSSAIYSACVLIAIFAVMAYGLDLVVSDLGEVSLAHTVFFAAGAYATALLSIRLDLGPFFTVLGAVAASVAIAAALGFVTLRLREFVFSLVTYAVAVVAFTIAQNWSFLGGSDGLVGVPPFTVGGAFVANSDRDLWPIAYVVLLVVLYVVHRFRRSRLATAAIMTHYNPRLAVMSGIDPQRTRLGVFMCSAPITALAGWLYAYQRAFVSADVLEIYFLILMLTAVVLVGRRLLLGPLIGVALILMQEKFLSLGAYVDRIILGSVLIIVLAFLPRGLVGLPEAFRRLVWRRAAVSHSDTRLEKTGL